MTENIPAPNKNTRLSGHEGAERRLLDAWSSGRLPHAWLISGQAGIGKATLAYRFARFVLANPMPGSEDSGLFGDAPPLPETLATDPEHPVARRIAAGGHADLHVIQRGPTADGKRIQTVIPVDAIRAAGHAMALTASEGGWRVIIVDGAEEMNPNAANALLKVLEEPPPKALILLVCHAPGRLLPTIRSRCCQLRLSPLSPETVATLLGEYRPDLTDDERALLARVSDGSIGRALTLAESDGIAIQHELVSLLTTLPDLDRAAAQVFAERFGRRDADAAWRTGVDLVGRTIATLVSTGARGSDPAAAGYGPAEADCFRRLQEMASLDRWAEVWEKTGHLFARADSISLDRKEVMLDALGMMESVARKGA